MSLDFGIWGFWDFGILGFAKRRKDCARISTSCQFEFESWKMDDPGLNLLPWALCEVFMPELRKFHALWVLKTCTWAGNAFAERIERPCAVLVRKDAHRVRYRDLVKKPNNRPQKSAICALKLDLRLTCTVTTHLLLTSATWLFSKIKETHLVRPPT